jgi:uncharacterized membrane protein SpoIIM required for sporulation
MALTPFMVNLLSYEEAREEELVKKRKKLNILQRHRDIIKVYTYLFCGMVLSLSIIFIMLPEQLTEQIFEDQISEIKIIRGSFVFSGDFPKILSNNIGVLSLSFLFSFLFGSGAIFVLAWNASVLSAAIGLLAKSIGGMKGLPLAILTFFPHGSLEILAYFIAGIAGGIISAAIVRRRSKQFWFIVSDTFQLMLVSFVLLVMAAIIESIHIIL